MLGRCNKCGYVAELMAKAKANDQRTRIEIPGWQTWGDFIRELRKIVERSDRFAKKLAEDSRVDPATLREPMTI